MIRINGYLLNGINGSFSQGRLHTAYSNGWALQASEIVLLKQSFFENGDDLIICNFLNTTLNRPMNLVAKGRWNNGKI